MAEEVKPNSHAYKEQKSKEHTHAEKVIQGEVTRKKRSLAKKAEDVMLSEDANTVKSYIFYDVFIPSLKDIIADIIKKTVDAVFYGSARSSSSYLERDRGATYVRYDKASYDKPYSSSNRRDYTNSSRRPRAYNRRAVHDLDDIMFIAEPNEYGERDFHKAKLEAENTLDALVEYTIRQGVVSVAHFYEMVGIKTNYTDWNYGWYELSGAHVDRVRDGYIIDLPRPVVLDEEDRVPF